VSPFIAASATGLLAAPEAAKDSSRKAAINQDPSRRVELNLIWFTKSIIKRSKTGSPLSPELMPGIRMLLSIQVWVEHIVGRYLLMSTARLPIPRSDKPKLTRRTLETELSDVLKLITSERNRELVARHLGWDGRSPCSLADAGAQHQVTRERARQLYAAALPVMRQNGVVPALDAVLSFVRDQRDELVSDVEQRLMQQGLTGGGISLQGVLRAARVFGRKPGFHLHQLANAVFVGPTKVAPGVVAAAMKAVARNGAARVSKLCHKGPRRHGAIDERLIRRILETRPDVRWLDDSREWFWLTSVPRNRLVSRVRKVLAVQPRIPLPKLHQAMSRAYQPIRLPEWALSAICAQLSWCQVSGQYLEARVVPRAKEVLTGGEAIVCATLREHGGMLALARLEQLCSRAGLKRDNMWRILSFSPAIERFGIGTYGLIGAQEADEVPKS
jgi:hypothetical protein